MSEIQWRHINCVIDVLKDHMTPVQALTWLCDVQPNLGERPLDAIADQRLNDALTEAKRFVTVGRPNSGDPAS